jgi:hypothetical protein
MSAEISMNIHEALLDIEIAFRQIEFATKLLTYCELRRIDPADFDSDHIVTLADGTLHYPTGHFSDADNMIRAAGVCASLAYGASALALDTGFDVAGMKFNSELRDDAGQLRTLIYMVRCAYAHGITDPHWEVRKKCLNHLDFNLDGIAISVDLRQLHGQRFRIEQIGGYSNWCRIRCATVRLLSAATRPSAN